MLALICGFVCFVAGFVIGRTRAVRSNARVRAEIAKLSETLVAELKPAADMPPASP